MRDYYFIKGKRAIHYRGPFETGILSKHRIGRYSDCFSPVEVTPNGCQFDYELYYAGARFTLLQTDDITDDQLRQAKAYLRAQRDVLGIRVLRLKVVRSIIITA